MFKPHLYNQTMKNLTEAIYRTSHKQAVHAYNVANASTPKFQPLQFDEELNRARKRRQGLESQSFNLEREMAELSKTSLKHTALTKLFSTKLGILNRIASMGKG